MFNKLNPKLIELSNKILNLKDKNTDTKF